MNKKVWIILGVVFLFFVVILNLVPIAGDDWGNYVIAKEGLRRILGFTLGMYNDWEGRIGSRLLIMIFTYLKFLWSIVNSLMITGLIYFGVKYLKPKNLIVTLLIFILSFLLMNIYTFSQVITWIAGNITYLFPTSLLIIYLFLSFNLKKKSKLITILLTIFNLCLPLFVENIAIVLVVLNIMLLVNDYIKNKTINKTRIVYLVASIIGTLIIMLAPGNARRLEVENLEFNSLSFIGKIVRNIPNLIYFTFTSNPVLLVLISVSGIILSLKSKLNKILKPVSILYLSFIPIFVLLTKSFSYAGFSTINIIILTLLFVVYFLLYVYLLYGNRKLDKTKVTFLLILAIISNGVMLLSPTWGYRTNFPTLILLTLLSIMVIDQFIKSELIIKWVTRSSIGLILVGMVIYITMFTSSYIANIDRKESIESQIGNNTIYIERFPEYINCNINPDNDFHTSKFKEYYHIPEDTEIILTEKTFKYLIFYRKK